LHAPPMEYGDAKLPAGCKAAVTALSELTFPEID